VAVLPAGRGGPDLPGACENSRWRERNRLMQKLADGEEFAMFDAGPHECGTQFFDDPFALPLSSFVATFRVTLARDVVMTTVR